LHRLASFRLPGRAPLLGALRPANTAAFGPPVTPPGLAPTLPLPVAVPATTPFCAAATDGCASEIAKAPAKAHATASGHAVLLPLLVLIIIHLP